MTENAASHPPLYSIDMRDGETAVIRLTGTWKVETGLPSDADVKVCLKERSVIRRIIFDACDLNAWDSGLLLFLIQVSDICRREKIETDRSGLPEGVIRLLSLAEAVPERKDARKSDRSVSFLDQLGEQLKNAAETAWELLDFIGSSALAFWDLLRGKARFRPVDFLNILQDCGPKALPIITLISILVGLILAFVGAIQLRMFGAEIFVANLVGLGMAREMGAMMAAVVMAGRTGAAYAAQLGAMQVNEEIDALSTVGVSPMEFLVLPRMLALSLMMPLLCIYADLMGILGGALVALTLLDISPLAYFHQTQASVPLHHFATGFIKSIFFGIIVALCGCFQGMRCGRSASAVGDAATSAVVTAIVLIIVWDALFTVIFNILDI